jgi:hypothetical protein
MINPTISTMPATRGALGKRETNGDRWETKGDTGDKKQKETFVRRGSNMKNPISSKSPKIFHHVPVTCQEPVMQLFAMCP